MTTTAVCYLLHFDRPYRHARHYLGSTTDLGRRLARHRSGTGAHLVEVITQAGIGFTLARTWPGGRQRERQLKKQGGRSRLCPICRGRRVQVDSRRRAPGPPGGTAPGDTARALCR